MGAKSVEITGRATHYSRLQTGIDGQWVNGVVIALIRCSGDTLLDNRFRDGSWVDSLLVCLHRHQRLECGTKDKPFLGQLGVPWAH